MRPNDFILTKIRDYDVFMMSLFLVERFKSDDVTLCRFSRMSIYVPFETAIDTLLVR